MVAQQLVQMTSVNLSPEIQFNDVKNQLSQSIGMPYDENLFKIFTIQRQHFPLLRECMYGSIQQTTNLPSESWNVFYEAIRSVKNSKNLQILLAAQPVSDIRVVGYQNRVQYAYLTIAEGGDMLVVGGQWVAVTGPEKPQLKHYPFLLPEEYLSN